MAKGKAKIRYAVECKTHGHESKLWAGRMVLVSKPQHARQRQAGCPICAAEARAEVAQQVAA